MMNSMVLCHPGTMENRPDAIYNQWILNNRNYTVGLLDIPTRNFPSQDIHEECVLVKKLAFSCNFRDKGTMHNMYESCLKKSNVSSNFLTSFGSEFCAEIVKTGSKVSHLKAGDRVIPDGTYPLKEDGVIGGLPTNYASQRYEILHEKQVLKIPHDMDIEKAAVFTIAGQTVYAMLRRLDIREGSNVLVLSATSNTSLSVLKALQKYNVKVFACTTKTGMDDLLKEQGADIILEDFFQEGSKLRSDLIEQKLVFDYVIDPFYDLHFPGLIPFMNFHCKYITCGFYFQHESFTPANNNRPVNYQAVFRFLMLRNISVIGNCLGSKRDLQNALDDYRRGDFDIRIDSVWSDDQVLDFLNRSFNDPKRVGKVVYRYE